MEPRESKKFGATRISRKEIIENITSLALALVLMLTIRSSVFEAFKIPSGSMIPTLLIGDHIFVNKFAYGLKVPFSTFFTGNPIYIFKREPPKPGDIVVFRFPRDEDIYYIKRVIGTPGDTVEIRGKQLYLNGKVQARESLSSQDADGIFQSLEDRYSRSNLEVHMEKLPEKPHWIMVDRNNYSGDSFGPITVPQDSFFVMGDNRDFSNDSRIWGFVPFKNVEGRAIVIWLSTILDFETSTFRFRPSRIGTLLK